LIDLVVRVFHALHFLWVRSTSVGLTWR